MNNTKYEKRISDLEDKLRELKSSPDNFYELYKQEQARAEDYKAKLRELVAVIEGALKIKDLWILNCPVNQEFEDEIMALGKMEKAFENGLKAAREG